MSDEVLHDLNVYPGAVIHEISTIPPTVGCGILCDLVNDAFDNGGWELVRELSIDQIYLFGLFLASMTAPQLKLPLPELASTGMSITSFFRQISQKAIESLLKQGIVTAELAERKGVIVRPPKSSDLIVQAEEIEGLPEGVSAARVSVKADAETIVMLPLDDKSDPSENKQE